jgi:pyruvate, water dikinase
MMKKLCAFLFFLSAVSCVQGQDYVASIPNYDAYKSLIGRPLSDKFSNIESVKVVYDLKQQKLYYFNSTLIRLHFEFVTKYLGYDKELDQFNADNYSKTESKRSFLLGNLNHIKGTNKWIFELASSDQMPSHVIQKFFNLIVNSFYSGKQLQFYLNTRDKIDLFNQNRFTIPCVKSDYIFNELQYQEVVSGSTVGILKYYKIKDFDVVKPKSDEIVVLDGTPDILPNVKAIIVNELQTPLSHLVILGKNRNIPIMAYTKVLNNTRIRSLLNKTVELRIAVDSFYISETTKKIKEDKKIRSKAIPLDTLVRELVDLSIVHKKGTQFMGSKAQNLSYLIAVSKDNSFKVPEYAHAIPFYFYRKHIQNKAIAPLLDELLSYVSKDSVIWINKQLAKIRKAIKEEPIDPFLLDLLNKKLGGQARFKNFRFRSSTNAEDIDGFNGAGLYESKTGILGDSIKTFEKAIKQVWASVWNESSYWEREIFGLDQKSIAMGVLVHRSFPDELANGVVITKNIFREDLEGIIVNVQKGENAVVKPAKGEVCEQFTVYNLNLANTRESRDDTDVDYISHSNLNNNMPLLSSQEINKLFLISKKIESKLNAFWRRSLNPKPVDIEFKIVGDTREIYIKQVRVFND